MNVRELVRRFPEIPADLHAEPTLVRFAETFSELLAQARSPSNCATEHDAANRLYLKLVGPLAIYGYGLSGRDEVLAEIRGLLEQHAEDPEGFVGRLLSADKGSGDDG